VSKYAEVLRPFMALMEKELHANSHKGDREGWLQMTEEQALGEIEYHVSKLSKAMTDMNSDGVREYAADVANLCMMLLDIGGQLKTATKSGQLTEHGYILNTWVTGVSAHDPVTGKTAEVDRRKYMSLTVATVAAITDLKKMIAGEAP